MPDRFCAASLSSCSRNGLGSPLSKSARSSRSFLPIEVPRDRTGRAFRGDGGGGSIRELPSCNVCAKGSHNVSAAVVSQSTGAVWQILLTKPDAADPARAIGLVEPGCFDIPMESVKPQLRGYRRLLVPSSAGTATRMPLQLTEH